ncbi:hypothetical protein cypCar_00034169, partial [Cyprinus carpio]
LGLNSASFITTNSRFSFTDDGCGHYVLGQESGVLSSENYPGTYPNNSWCEWRIRVPIGHTIVLKFGDLNMEKKDCESDYLKVLKGSYGAEIVSWEYCGGLMPKPAPIHTDSSELTVRFRSSQHISGRGFLLSYSTENHKELLTCLDRGSHFPVSKYRKYCPAGCAAVTGDVSGDISLGYRHVSSVSLFSSGVAGMPQLIPRPRENVRQVYLQGCTAKHMLSGVAPKRFLMQWLGQEKQLL